MNNTVGSERLGISAHEKLTLLSVESFVDFLSFFLLFESSVLLSLSDFLVDFFFDLLLSLFLVDFFLDLESSSELLSDFFLRFFDLSSDEEDGELFFLL